MHRIIILFLFLPVCLTAQQNDISIFGKGWYLSLMLQPEVDSKFILTPYVTANDTLPRSTGTVYNPYPRFGVTSPLDGDETLYYEEPNLRRKAEREQIIYNLLASIRFHYRVDERLEISAGFFFLPTFNDEEITEDPFEDLPDDFYYSSWGTKETYGGLMADFNYHLRKGKRLRPYVGLQGRFGVRHTEGIRLSQIFPGLNQEVGSIENVVERFRVNTIFDFDLDLLAGINYQLNDRFVVGLEAHLGRFLVPVPRALVVRYRLKSPGGEPNR
ncbi:hypothetical protein FUA23_08275 [Neolewinella aurantiaca]|uniref:Uncharacterized protein n=1 Tax=Neolewinella aurantiaca TaxID=2602767 RepID=A0A5C7FUE6_9BACT|nr:hypothetical protein [Neolewinella aurantiaca]TXF89944.1 hypothetical protein FUA23_08275 [Neolewinella aurantiaca]